jgi:hypothetical protein
MKTTLQHFKENLTNEELERAISNTPKHKINYKTKKPSFALSGAFTWADSPEGYEYWSAIADHLMNQQK